MAKRLAVTGGLLVVLSGCTAGSPAIIVPEPTPAVMAAAADQSADPPATEVAAVVATSAPPTAVPAVVVETAPDPVTPAPAAEETAAFSHDVPQVAKSDQAAPANDEPAASVSAAPAAQTDRPPAPPDPGTGLSTIIEGGTNDRLEVALTFDAGADTGYAAQILDLLQAEGIHATFGMTGQWAQANPDLVRRMVNEGHQLINHTWDHSSLTGANTGMPPETPEQVAEQLSSTESLVSDLTGGYQMRPYFRPPYGDYDEASLGYLYDNGYYLSIWWTCDSHGWAGWGSQEIIDYCTTNLSSDEILLLHVGSAAAGDFEALPGLIKFFRDNGYAFVTVEQMLQP